MINSFCLRFCRFDDDTSVHTDVQKDGAIFLDDEAGFPLADGNDLFHFGQRLPVKRDAVIAERAGR